MYVTVLYDHMKLWWLCGAIAEHNFVDKRLSNSYNAIHYTGAMAIMKIWIKMWIETRSKNRSRIKNRSKNCLNEVEVEVKWSSEVKLK